MTGKAYIALVPDAAKENARTTTGTFYVVAADGKVTQGKWNSGGYGRGPLPGSAFDLHPDANLRASYTHSDYSEMTNYFFSDKGKGFGKPYTIGNVSGWMRMEQDDVQLASNPATEGVDGLGYHPDGNKPGSKGCVVFDKENAKKFFGAIEALPEDQKPGHSFVLNPGDHANAQNHAFLKGLEAAEKSGLSRQMAGTATEAGPTEGIVLAGAEKSNQTIVQR